ncbi:MAG: DUF4249 family protein [Bacteroidales bacterium]
MKKIFIIIAAVIAFSACTKRIDIELDQQEYARLVVEGSFSTDTTAHLVELTQTGDYFENQPPAPVSGAAVRIYNDLEEYQLEEKPANSGRYFTASDVYGTVGRDYHLEIMLDEEIGGYKLFEAASHIYPINELDSITLEFYDWGKAGFYEVQCYVLDPPTTDYYMFHIYRNGELVNDTITDVFVVDDLLYNGNYTNGIGVGYFDQNQENEKLVPGDIVTLQVSRITEEYTDFLWHIQVEVSYRSPLFSGPPANVNGNISNGAFGAFAAYSSSYASTMVQPKQ